MPGNSDRLARQRLQELRQQAAASRRASAVRQGRRWRRRNSWAAAAGWLLVGAGLRLLSWRAQAPPAVP